jgi:hypothetical protein
MASPSPEQGGAASLGGSGNLPPDTERSLCENETIEADGVQRCSNGILHRASSARCSLPSTLPEYVSEAEFPPGSGPYECTANADCNAKPVGVCMISFPSPYCIYGCVTDRDCEAGELCRCNGEFNRCEATKCRTDSDCPGGQLCASNTRCSFTQFVCTTSNDECLLDSDCSSGSSCVILVPSQVNPLVSPAAPHRVCQLNQPCATPGRPFLVAGEQRLAPLTARCDWYSAAEGEPVPSQLAAELRAELARGWAEQALMEHASVAAFARFTLQLLSLGAPAELVARSSEAMSDELRHTQDCFRLARRYSEGELGPGPLPVAGALETAELCDIVLSTLHEGCMGETVAAIEAAEALEHCTDVEARPVLERIAAEETRHAELAWRFVAWALETAAEPRRAELCRRIRAELAEELSAPVSAGGLSERDRELARHGLLGSSLRQALRARVLREVVAPCAEALLASAPAAMQPARLVGVGVERQRTVAREQPGVSARQVIAG